MASIKAKIIDSEALKTVTRAALEGYLSNRGWQPPNDKNPYYWNPSLPDYGITVPNPAYRDYALRIGEVIAILARIEGRSQLDIYCELVGKPTYEELERELEAYKLALEVACTEPTSELPCPITLSFPDRIPCPFDRDDGFMCDRVTSGGVCWERALLRWAREFLKGGPTWRELRDGKDGE